MIWGWHHSPRSTRRLLCCKRKTVESATWTLEDHDRDAGGSDDDYDGSEFWLLDDEGDDDDDDDDDDDENDDPSKNVCLRCKVTS